MRCVLLLACLLAPAACTGDASRAAADPSGGDGGRARASPDDAGAARAEAEPSRRDAADAHPSAAPAASCCAGQPVCRHVPVTELPPAPADLTGKEQRLRRVHEELRAGNHVFFSDAPVQAALDRLAALGPGADPFALATARWTAGLYLMRAGQLDASAALLERCVDDAARDDGTRAALLPELLYAEALAWLRLAERRNCIARHTAESCIFPLRGGAVHVDREGSERALAALERLVALEVPERAAEARWLVNVVHMTLGSYPDGVPAALLVPPERFASQGELAAFTDVAPRVGLDRFSRAGSVVLDDLDGDGLLDVLTSSFDPAQPLQLHRNRGDGGFDDVTAAAGLAHQLGGAHLLHGDVDGDGLLDVLVLRGCDLEHAGCVPDSLLRQQEPLRFADVTAEAGLELDAPSQSACFADVDLDGDLDLAVAYQALCDLARPGAAPTAIEGTVRLYLNDGAGVFRDGTAAAGITTRAVCLAAVFGDVDGDGFPDLFLSNEDAPNELWLNGGDGTFTEAAAERGVTEPIASRAAWFFDRDNDGDLDLFVAYSHHDLAARAVATWYAEGTVATGTPRLYDNDGRGHFADVTAAAGLARVVYPLGASFGDLDGDGWPDIYLATGAHEMEALWPNVALRSERGERFLDVTTAGGLGHLQKGQAVAFGDVDDDGDSDLFVQVGGHFPDDGFGDVLFENPGSGARWLSVDLVGAASNRFGVGARVRARIAEPLGRRPYRDVYAWVGGDGPFGRGSLRAELGLGGAIRIMTLEVRWPGRGLQQFRDVPLDRRVVVHEDRDELDVLEPAPFRLGG